MIYLIGNEDHRVLAVADGVQNIVTLAQGVYEVGGVQLVSVTMLESELIADVGDLYVDGQFIKPQTQHPSPEELQAEIVTATQQRLDDFARTRKYDGILSLCTYATSTNHAFAKEGQYGVNMRDATWAKLYEMLAEVEAGIRPVPTGYVDIEAELPVLGWPV